MMSEKAVEQPGDNAFLRIGPVLAVFRRHVRALARIWKVAITWFVIEPIIVLMALALGVGQLVGTLEDGSTYAEFVAPGIVLGTAMFHAIGESAWAAYDRVHQGVYETMLTAPVKVEELVMAELLFAGFRSIISTVTVAGFAILLGWIPLWALPGLILISIGVGAVFAGIGQLFAATVPTTTVLTMVFTLVATPIYFFSGSFFPIDVLPDWIEPVAWVTPLTPLVQLARGLIAGDLGMTHLWMLCYVLFMAGGFYLLAVGLMKRRLLR